MASCVFVALRPLVLAIGEVLWTSRVLLTVSDPTACRNMPHSREASCATGNNVTQLSCRIGRLLFSLRRGFAPKLHILRRTVT
jgi:hypothetical protein